MKKEFGDFASLGKFDFGILRAQENPILHYHLEMSIPVQFPKAALKVQFENKFVREFKVVRPYPKERCVDSSWYPYVKDEATLIYCCLDYELLFRENLDWGWLFPFYK